MRTPLQRCDHNRFSSGIHTAGLPQHQHPHEPATTETTVSTTSATSSSSTSAAAVVVVTVHPCAPPIVDAVVRRGVVQATDAFRQAEEEESAADRHHLDPAAAALGGGVVRRPMHVAMRSAPGSHLAAISASPLLEVQDAWNATSLWHRCTAEAVAHPPPPALQRLASEGGIRISPLMHLATRQQNDSDAPPPPPGRPTAAGRAHQPREQPPTAPMDGVVVWVADIRQSATASIVRDGWSSLPPRAAATTTTHRDHHRVKNATPSTDGDDSVSVARRHVLLVLTAAAAVGDGHRRGGGSGCNDKEGATNHPDGDAEARTFAYVLRQLALPPPYSSSSVPPESSLHHVVMFAGGDLASAVLRMLTAVVVAANAPPSSPLLVAAATVQGQDSTAATAAATTAAGRPFAEWALELERRLMRLGDDDPAAWPLDGSTTRVLLRAVAALPRFRAASSSSSLSMLPLVETAQDAASLFVRGLEQLREHLPNLHAFAAFLAAQPGGRGLPSIAMQEAFNFTSDLIDAKIRRHG